MTQHSELPALIAIGASAGGLEALLTVIGELPVGAAYIILLHQDPSAEILLQSVLESRSMLPVREIQDDTLPEAGVLYFTPPGRHITFECGRLSLSARTSSPLPIPSIDRFFSSAAKLVPPPMAIILSGMGNDGSNGMADIRAAGGVTLAQLPSEAQYSDMPSSALSQGAALRAITITELPAVIGRFLEDPAQLLTPPPLTTEEAESLEQVITMMRHHTNTDFSQYKRKTIERRLQRRLSLLRLDSISQYLAFVRKQPEDLFELARDVLISVTSFFRDPDAFEFLEDALSETMAQKPPLEPIRIWIPACATGEEAYSTAIMLAELLSEDFFTRKIQIFATDLDDRAIDTARRGLYSSAAVESLPESILTRYFRKEADGYEIIKSIRERIVFARQDLVKDPPFSHLDLISCRNLLIYHQADLQSRIIRMFHYALAPEGLLFLGKSESLGSSDELFTTVSGKFRVFRKRSGVSAHPFSYPRPVMSPPRRSGTEAQGLPPRLNSIEELVRREVCERFAPPSLLVDDHNEILHVKGDVSPWLQLFEGDMGRNVFDFTREELRMDLRVAIHQAQRDRTPVTVHGLVVPGSGAHFHLHINPVEGPHPSQGLLLVSFEAAHEAIETAGTPTLDRGAASITELEQELALARSQVQSFFQEIETANQELQSLNEELQSANEELQSTNEEMETSNEELQATNEELITVNEELEIKSAELATANRDLENILRRMGLAMILVDEELRVKRFTPSASTIFNLMPGDRGQVLPNVGSHIHIPNLREDLTAVLEGGQSIGRFIEAGAKVFEVKYHPYYDEQDTVHGALLTFYDSTPGYRREQELRALAENSPDIVARFSPQGRVLYMNRAFERYSDMLVRECFDRKLTELPLGPEVIEAIETNITCVCEHERECSFEFELDTSRGHRIFETRFVPEHSPTGNITSILAISKDITRERHAQRMEKQAHQRMLDTLESISDGFFVLDESQRVIYFNEAAGRLFGRNPAEVLGRTMSEALPRSGDTILERMAETALASRERQVFEIWYGDQDTGTGYAVRIYPQAKGISLYFQDITSQKRSEKLLLESEKRFRSIVETAWEGILELSADGRILSANPSMERILGISREELTGQNLLDHLTGGSRARIEPLLSHSITPPSVPELVTFPRPNGAGMQCLITLSPFSRETTSSTVMLAMLTDVTGLMKAKEQLVASEKKYQALFKHSPIQTFIWEAASEGLVLHECNDSALAQAGDASIIGRRAADLLKASPRLLELLDECTRKGRPGQEEVPFQPSYLESPLITMVHCAPIGPELVQLLVIDVTEQRHMEQNLRQTQKLEAIGTLATGIAHDFNNSLASIIGFSQLCLEEVGDHHPLSDNITEIFKAGLHSKDLVDRLANFTRQDLTERRPIRIEKLTEGILEMLRSSIPASITLTFEHDGGPLTVSAVPDQMEQILVTLCTNAWEAIGNEGGEISVSLAPAIPPGMNPADPRRTFAQLRVHDNGAGILPEHVGRAADPYFTTKPDHSGVGLSVVSSIVAAHGGSMQIESEVGYGTQVIIYLPLASPKGISQELPTLHAIEGGKEHILLVDDEAQIIRMHTIILTRLGYTVTAFTSPVDALNAFVENPRLFDLILTDMTMPKINGDALARTVRETRPDIPVILCTGYSDRLGGATDPVPDVDRVLGKPTDKSLLSRAIRELLDSRHIEDEPAN